MNCHRMVILIALMLAVSACASAPTTVAAPTAAPAPLSPPVQVALTPEAAALSDAMSQENADAFRRLLGATVFEDRAVGYSGSLSKNVEAFRQLRREPNAREVFKLLSVDGTIVGRLYGAVGLYDLDRPAFEKAVKNLSTRGREVVETQRGCFSMQASVSELLDEGSPAAIRLADGQSLNDWLALHKTGKMDIVGGAYTSSFIEPTYAQ